MAKKSRRSGTKHAGLHPELHPRIRRDVIDYDYLHKLSEEELEFLSKFTDEFVGASLCKEEDRNTNLDKDLHRTRKLRKSLRDSNNAKNRDTYSVMKTVGRLDGVTPTTIERKQKNDAHEDNVIQLLDLKDKQVAKELAKRMKLLKKKKRKKS